MGDIVEILAVNQDPASGQYYLAMEFIEGGNLREILNIRKKLTPRESLRIISDAANGLGYAYAHGVTHRDIKLTNLLISSTGVCKLVDFGLAKLYANEKEKIDRTVDYAGLERATGVDNNDVRSDIYFLGCVLYECLTGRSPLIMTRDNEGGIRALYNRCTHRGTTLCRFEKGNKRTFQCPYHGWNIQNDGKLRGVCRTNPIC